MTVQEMFDAVAARLMAEDPSIERAKMFASMGLRTGGKFFAMAMKDELGLKLPRERVDELVASGAGQRMGTGGRQMKEWISLRPAAEAACAAYVTEAREFVASQAQP